MPRTARTKVSAWVIVPLVVAATALVVAAGWGAWAALGPHSPRVAPSVVTPSQATTPSATASETPAPTVEPSSTSPENRTPRATTNPNIPDPALDAFIAEQYPGYRVEKRISFPAQYDRGRLGVNYLLAEKRQPAFSLLVSVAHLKPGEKPGMSTSYMVNVGRVLTNDSVLSANARTQNQSLTVARQQAIVDAFVAKQPAKGAILFDGVFDEDGGFNFAAEIGDGALERAMQDSGGGAKYAVFGRFLKAKGPQVQLTVEKN